MDFVTKTLPSTHWCRNSRFLSVRHYANRHIYGYHSFSHSLHYIPFIPSIHSCIHSCIYSLCMCVHVLCAADSMDSSSKQFVSADDVAVMNGDSNAGTYIACILYRLLYRRRRRTRFCIDRGPLQGSSSPVDALSRRGRNPIKLAYKLARWPAQQPVPLTN